MMKNKLFKGDYKRPDEDFRLTIRWRSVCVQRSARVDWSRTPTNAARAPAQRIF